MPTFGQMVGRIREDLDRGSNFDARIKQAIVDAIRFYRSNRLPFNTKRARAVTQPGQEHYPLPLDWIEADFLRLETEGNRDPIRPVTYDWMEDHNRNDGNTGRPLKYAVQASELRLYPVPDRSYTLVLSFLYDLTGVSLSASDAESNAWTDEAEELIRKHAMSDLKVNYIGGADQIAEGQLLRRECSDEILPVLVSKAARQNSSGRMRAFL
jgi:hypothetical protein